MNNTLPVTSLVLSVTMVIDIQRVVNLQIKKCVTQVPLRSNCLISVASIQFSFIFLQRKTISFAKVLDLSLKILSDI